MDRMETEFLEKEHLKPWVWLRYIDDIFFVWTHGDNKLDGFLERLNSFHPNLKFTSERSQQEINFHYFDCNSKCLIYLMSCKVCGKQYVGSTTDRFRFRWNNYKSCQRKAERGEDCMQKYFHDHFLSEGHNGLIDDVEIVFIDKTDPSDPTRREEFWRNELKTLAPYGLNVEE